jgi:hypothetical protein
MKSAASTAASAASCATPALCIEHSATADMPDGQPLPPLNGVDETARSGVVCRFPLPLLQSPSGARRREIKLKHERRKDKANGYEKVF